MLNVLKSKVEKRDFIFWCSLFMVNACDDYKSWRKRFLIHFLNWWKNNFALVKGYHSYDRVKKDYPNVNIYPVSNTLEMIKAVSEGKADVSYGLKRCTRIQYK